MGLEIVALLQKKAFEMTFSLGPILLNGSKQ